MKMSIKARRALEMSIAHWERVMDDPRCTPTGLRYCKLCYVYKSGQNYECYGCPVFTHTDKICCKGTPFHKFTAAVRSKEGIKLLRKLADDELQFLISLREE